MTSMRGPHAVPSESRMTGNEYQTGPNPVRVKMIVIHIVFGVTLGNTL